MHVRLEMKLEQAYPEILKNLHGAPSETCMSDMHGGISCGDGWYDLLDKLMDFCQFNTDKNAYPQLVADQIKEKFGSLRFYYHFEDNPKLEDLKKSVTDIKNAVRPASYIRGAIDFTQSLSSSVCENCGAPGKINRGGWVKCLCDECRNN